MDMIGIFPFMPAKAIDRIDRIDKTLSFIYPLILSACYR
ncbi:hypothetical protein AO376_0371 [Moraxella catarrhalis]|nr:hypothetical protein AO376_0371 [Moraxella catarrhalis]OAV17032.1 hypothetical protein AO374_1567 [Moraxella catarrhalis]